MCASALKDNSSFLKSQNANRNPVHNIPPDTLRLHLLAPTYAKL